MKTTLLPLFLAETETRTIDRKKNKHLKGKLQAEGTREIMSI
jgi:hypothetical protein